MVGRFGGLDMLDMEAPSSLYERIEAGTSSTAVTHAWAQTWLAKLAFCLGAVGLGLAAKCVREYAVGVWSRHGDHEHGARLQHHERAKSKQVTLGMLQGLKLTTPE